MTSKQLPLPEIAHLLLLLIFFSAVGYAAAVDLIPPEGASGLSQLQWIIWFVGSGISLALAAFTRSLAPINGVWLIFAALAAGTLDVLSVPAPDGPFTQLQPAIRAMLNWVAVCGPGVMAVAFSIGPVTSKFMSSAQGSR